MAAFENHGKQRGRLVGVAIALLLVVPTPLCGQTVERTVWVNPVEVDLSAGQAAGRLLDEPVQRVIVSCFVGGETLFPTHSNLFAQMPRYRDKGEVLGSLVRSAHRKGIKSYAFLDCLHWTIPGTPKTRDVLDRHAELAERNREGGCGVGPDGKYASPFHPRVRSALRELVVETAAACPDLDGVVLQCRLPLGSLLGYSEPSRAAYIRAKQIDPVDITFAGNKEDRKIALDWVGWRMDQMASLVQELAGSFKSRNQSGKVAAVGYANWYRFPLTSRMTTLEDWLKWGLTGSIDEVLLEARWDQPANKEAFAFCQTLIERTGKALPVSVLVPLREGETELPFETMVAALQGQAVSRVVLGVARESDLERVERFWTESFPKVENSLLAKEPSKPEVQAKTSSDIDGFYLRKDPRLFAKLTFHAVSPGVNDLLARVQQATGLTLSVDKHLEGFQPGYGDMTFREVPAFGIMEVMADKVQGRWEKSENGYRLVGTVPGQTMPRHKGNDRLVLGITFGVVGTLLLVAVIAMVVRRRTRGPGPKSTL